MAEVKESVSFYPLLLFIQDLFLDHGVVKFKHLNCTIIFRRYNYIEAWGRDVTYARVTQHLI